MLHCRNVMRSCTQLDALRQRHNNQQQWQQKQIAFVLTILFIHYLFTIAHFFLLKLILSPWFVNGKIKLASQSITLLVSQVVHFCFGEWNCKQNWKLCCWMNVCCLVCTSINNICKCTKWRMFALYSYSDAVNRHSFKVLRIFWQILHHVQFDSDNCKGW